MTTHSLDFKNDGRIELTVNYRASIEGEMLSPEANLFFEMQEKINQATNLKRRAVDIATEDLDKRRAKLKRRGADAREVDADAQEELAEVKKSLEQGVNLQTDLLKYKVYQH
jgi:uncharacterized protein YqfA (UPF0365 family)